MPPHRRAAAVHPRACGEQQVAEIIVGVIGGSSPRMRGTGLLRPSASSHHRFIPAHAGNSDSSLITALGDAVHPRACGEQTPGTFSQRTASGSSPRMRGTEPYQSSETTSPRFIPAHAGNRGALIPATSPAPVHPRACGEQAFCLCSRFARSGSSPRMRGTALAGGRHAGSDRFIPAHAGNRSATASASMPGPVHPRACGEQIGLGAGSRERDGSSPRMRGTGRGRISPVARGRFIPAHAGNRASIPVPECRPPVHPRACGEQMRKKEAAQFSAGSSPRMRGTG